MRNIQDRLFTGDGYYYEVKTRLEHKINVTLLALLPNKIVQDSRGPATSSEKTGHEEQGSRNKRVTDIIYSLDRLMKQKRYIILPYYYSRAI